MKENSNENRARALYALFAVLAVVLAVTVTALLMGCSMPEAFTVEESLSYELTDGVFVDAWGEPERVTLMNRNGNERAAIIYYGESEKRNATFIYDAASVLQWPVSSRTFTPIRFSSDERTFTVSSSTWELIDE